MRDGKVICSIKSEETDKQLHLLAVQEAEVNLTVAQTALERGENEISAGKRLLEKVDLTGKSVSGRQSLPKKNCRRRWLKTEVNICGNCVPMKAKYTTQPKLILRN